MWKAPASEGAQQKAPHQEKEALLRLKPRQIFAMARLIIGAVRAALEEVETAKAPGSPGGKKVTAEEAIDVAAAILGSLVDPIADILAG